MIRVTKENILSNQRKTISNLLDRCFDRRNRMFF